MRNRNNLNGTEQWLLTPECIPDCIVRARLFPSSQNSILNETEYCNRVIGGWNTHPSNYFFVIPEQLEHEIFKSYFTAYLPIKKLKPFEAYQLLRQNDLTELQNILGTNYIYRKDGLPFKTEGAAKAAINKLKADFGFIPFNAIPVKIRDRWAIKEIATTISKTISIRSFVFKEQFRIEASNCNSYESANSVTNEQITLFF